MHFNLLPSRGLRKVLQVRVSVFKSPRQHGQDKGRRGPSTPRTKRCVIRSSVTRFAQDDDFAGGLRKNIKQAGRCGIVVKRSTLLRMTVLWEVRRNTSNKLVVVGSWLKDPLCSG